MTVDATLAELLYRGELLQQSMEDLQVFNIFMLGEPEIIGAEKSSQVKSSQHIC